MSCPIWQWHRTGSSWSPVRTLPVAPLWCDLGFVPNSSGNKAAVNLHPKVSKKSLFKWLFKKNGFLAVSGSELGLELTTSSLRQNSSWACFITLCCINPHIWHHDLYNILKCYIGVRVCDITNRAMVHNQCYVTFAMKYVTMYISMLFICVAI